MHFTTPLLSLSLISAASAVPLPESGEQWRAFEDAKSGAILQWKSVAHEAFKGVAAAIGWYDLPALEAMGAVLDPGDNDKSVYQWLKSSEKFSNITKLIDYDEEFVKHLDQSSHGLTFFAPNNDAFPKRRSRKDEDQDEDLSFEWALLNSEDDLLSSLLYHGESLMKGSDDDKKKKIFKRILHDVLLYHTLPTNAALESINRNFTLATEYKADDGSYNGQSRRIKIEHKVVPPSTTINKYVQVVSSDYKGANGVVHEIDHPLLPPPGIFDVAFMLPKYFSTFTSAAQKSGLDHFINYKYNNETSKFEGSPSVTVFVPTNDAFAKLPNKLLFYLFSPFGQHALEALLKLHVVPKFIIHSEWIHDAKDKKPGEDFNMAGTELDFSFPFPSALGKNYTLPVHIKKTTPIIPVPGVAYVEFTVQDQSLDYTDIDWVARNGAVHVVHSVLNPHFKHDSTNAQSNDWENWEEWLPRWAADQE